MRLVLRLLYTGWHIGSGVFQMAVLFRFCSEAQKRRRIQVWSQQLLDICRVRLVVRGLPPQPGESGRMLVANHVSWLDIFAMNAVMPNRFIAKADIARWPVVGYLIRQAGTLFVSRERNSGTQDKVSQATQILQGGDNLALFPEGTTSEGDVLLPFKSSFFQVAIDVGCPVWPVLCRYVHVDGSLNKNMAYCGDTSLWESMNLILGQEQAGYVVVDYLPSVPAQATRRELANQVYERLAQKLQEPVDLVGVASQTGSAPATELAEH